MADDWTERRITASQALRGSDGAVALGLELDDGTMVAGQLDLRTIEGIRRQLDKCAAWLRSEGPQPAQ